MPGEAPAPSLLARIRRGLGGEGVGAILVRGASGAAGAHVAGAVIALAAQLALARVLGVSQYGYYVYALTWVMILAPLCRLGFQNSLIRFTAAYRAEGDFDGLRGLVTRAAQLVLATAVAGGLALAAVTGALGERLAADQLATFWIAAAVVVPVALLGVTQGILQGYRRTARALLPFRTFVHGGTLVLAGLAALTVGLERASTAMTLTLVAALAALAVAGYWSLQSVRGDIADAASDDRTRYWVRASLPLLLMAGMRIVMKHTDTAMLGAIAGTDAAGVYFPTARMSELAAIGLMSANAIVAPMISDLYTRGDRARLQRLLTLAAIGTSAVTVAAAVAFWLVGEWVLALFGPAFPAAWPALMVLLGGQMVNALCGPVGFLMTMTGHQDRASLVVVCGAVVNVALNALLIPRYGLMGAAAATATSVAIWNLWMLVEVARRHRLNPTAFARWPRLVG